MTQHDRRILAVVDLLPVAIGLIDRTGRVLGRYGALRDVLGEVIPSRDTSQRWQVFDYDFKPVDRHNWPSDRALRGETNVSGSPALYTAPDGTQCWMRVTAVWVNDDVVSVVSISEDITQERRALRKLRDDMEERFAELLVSAARTVMHEGEALTIDAARSYVQRNMDHPLATDPPANGLTSREIEVMKLIVFGEKHKDIAAGLGITVKTVEAHRTKVANKLGLHTRAEILRYALRQGWLTNE